MKTLNLTQKQVKPVIKGYKQVGFMGDPFPGNKLILPEDLEFIIQEDIDTAERDQWDYSKSKSKFRAVYC